MNNKEGGGVNSAPPKSAVTIGTDTADKVVKVFTILCINYNMSQAMMENSYE